MSLLELTSFPSLYYCPPHCPCFPAFKPFAHKPLPQGLLLGEPQLLGPEEGTEKNDCFSEEGFL